MAGNARRMPQDRGESIGWIFLGWLAEVLLGGLGAAIIIAVAAILWGCDFEPSAGHNDEYQSATGILTGASAAPEPTETIHAPACQTAGEFRAAAMEQREIILDVGESENVWPE